MADEIRVNTSLAVTKGELKYNPGNRNQSIDLAGTRDSGGTQDIGTTHEALTIGSDMSSVGVSEFTNLDATNYVEIGVEVAAAFYPLVKLLPGETWVFRLGTTTPFAKANTAAVKLRKQIFEA